jgi:hypothetical protein
MQNEEIHIATAEDFQNAIKQRQIQEAKPLRLPASGLVVLARKPDPVWWIRHLGQLPASLSNRLNGSEEVAQTTTEELIKYSNWSVDLIREIVVQPVIKLNPGPGEVDPNWILDEDLKFLVRYAGGEVSADGADLSLFPGKSESDDAAGASGA